jgi:hypothetical protein
MEGNVHISRVKRDELAVAEEKRLRRTRPKVLQLSGFDATLA